MIPIRDNVPRRTTPYVTWAIIAVNALAFLYELALPPEEVQRLFYLFGIVPARFTHPDWARWIGFPIDDYWPFLTSMFLHGGWIHIIGNMWALWIFGDNVEDRMGHGRFLFFYLLTGLAAGLTHWFTSPDSTLPTVGASGAIAGVLGAYFVLFPRSRIIAMFPLLFLPVFFELPAVTYLLFWLFAQIFTGALAGVGPPNAGGVAWWAHVGGFVAGVALHRLFLLPRRLAPRPIEPDEYGIEGAWYPRY
jgi:membrane associated rhomboid family serine protease